MACNECAIPLCGTCYGYERREGSHDCIQCKTRLKRLKGCATVEGDEEEDDIDDLENISSISMEGVDRICRRLLLQTTPICLNFLSLLTVKWSNALVPCYISSAGGGGKRIYPLAFSDLAIPTQSRSMDPFKGLAAYGYGSVAWKERMESWKLKTR